MSLLNLRPIDEIVLSHLEPDQDPFRLFDGTPDPVVVSRIAEAAGLSDADVHYSLKFLKMQRQIPPPPLEPVQDLLTYQIQKAVTRLSAIAPLPLWDKDGPHEGTVLRIYQHCAYTPAQVRDRLRQLRTEEVAV
jgi:hypothetical protein